MHETEIEMLNKILEKVEKLDNLLNPKGEKTYTIKEINACYPAPLGSPLHNEFMENLNILK